VAFLAVSRSRSGRTPRTGSPLGFVSIPRAHLPSLLTAGADHEGERIFSAGRASYGSPRAGNRFDVTGFFYTQTSIRE